MDHPVTFFRLSGASGRTAGDPLNQSKQFGTTDGRIPSADSSWCVAPAGRLRSQQFLVVRLTDSVLIAGDKCSIVIILRMIVPCSSSRSILGGYSRRRHKTVAATTRE